VTKYGEIQRIQLYLKFITSADELSIRRNFVPHTVRNLRLCLTQSGGQQNRFWSLEYTPAYNTQSLVHIQCTPGVPRGHRWPPWTKFGGRGIQGRAVGFCKTEEVVLLGFRTGENCSHIVEWQTRRAVRRRSHGEVGGWPCCRDGIVQRFGWLGRCRGGGRFWFGLFLRAARAGTAR
jgi:hypothetical protein